MIAASIGSAVKPIVARLFWLACLAQLVVFEPASDAGRAALVFTASWTAGSLLFLPQRFERRSHLIELSQWQRMLAAILLRFGLLVLVSIAVLITGYASVLLTEPILPAVFLVLSLLIGFRRASNSALGRSADLNCPLFVFIALTIAEFLGAHGYVFLLVLCVLCLLVLILQDLPQLPRVFFRTDQPKPEARVTIPHAISSGEVLMRHGDVFVVLALVADPALCVPYLLAKAFSEIMVLIFDQMGSASMPALRDAFHGPSMSAFNAVAARLNLGFLLVGGGIGVLVIGMVQIAEPFLLGYLASFPAILIWLLLGQCGPAIFGATGWLMKAADLSGLNHVLDGLSVVPSALIMLSVGIGDPVTFAKAFALCQLARSALGAALLGYLLGIWPGVTAVLFRQLKIL